MANMSPDMTIKDTPAVFQRCVFPRCGATLPMEDTSFRCPSCGGLMDVAYDWDRLAPPKSLAEFEAKWSRRTTPVCALAHFTANFS